MQCAQLLRTNNHDNSVVTQQTVERLTTVADDVDTASILDLPNFCAVAYSFSFVFPVRFRATRHLAFSAVFLPGAYLTVVCIRVPVDSAPPRVTLFGFHVAGWRVTNCVLSLTATIVRHVYFNLSGLCCILAHLF